MAIGLILGDLRNRSLGKTPHSQIIDDCTMGLLFMLDPFAWVQKAIKDMIARIYLFFSTLVCAPICFSCCALFWLIIASICGILMLKNPRAHHIDQFNKDVKHWNEKLAPAFAHQAMLVSDESLNYANTAMLHVKSGYPSTIPSIDDGDKAKVKLPINTSYWSDNGKAFTTDHTRDQTNYLTATEVYKRDYLQVTVNNHPLLPGTREAITSTYINASVPMSDRKMKSCVLANPTKTQPLCTDQCMALNHGYFDPHFKVCESGSYLDSDEMIILLDDSYRLSEATWRSSLFKDLHYRYSTDTNGATPLVDNMGSVKVYTMMESDPMIIYAKWGGFGLSASAYAALAVLFLACCCCWCGCNLCTPCWALWCCCCTSVGVSAARQDSGAGYTPLDSGFDGGDDTNSYL
ncbi:hypothetical protein J8273_6758 [Carpediemonas membranifera]|uniref:Uncharacterized protein n=1 Tax=Carpediemonas membranifera TaxID=201153 RepID=A0A8J6BW10_9EUKA|nr:hypothetical protein J8273_6758 [Carpediemonas membranifera]|eukprot:KAG9391956.1 hypothetical protein J8273_6758 [Carpediemonas membranifera]